MQTGVLKQELETSCSVFCTARGLCHCLPFSHALMHELHKTMSNSVVEKRPSIVSVLWQEVHASTFRPYHTAI